MAQIIIVHEQQREDQSTDHHDRSNLIDWAVNRVKSISPTINEAEVRLKGVLEALNYKQKSMMEFVLKKNHLSSAKFFD